MTIFGNCQRILSLLAGLFFYCVSAYPADQNIIMFRQLSTTQGLSNNSITAIYRDSRGFLWVGTASGLNRYDSYTFKPFFQEPDQLPDNRITDIFEDRVGNIWVHTPKGYVIYDYSTGRFNPISKAVYRQFNMSCDTIIQAGTDTHRNYIWCTDSARIYLYDYKQKTTRICPLAEPAVTNIRVTDKYIYTVYNSGKLYSTENASSHTREIPIPVQYHSLLENQQPGVYIDSNAGIWMYTYQNSLLLYKKNAQAEWEEIVLSPQDEQFNRIRSISEDAQGNIWLITSHTGAFIYQPKSGMLTNLLHNPYQSHTLASNNLSAIHIDWEGIVWIGNFKHGISHYVPQSQVFLNRQFSSYNDILSFCEDEQALWLGTDGGGLLRLTAKSTEPERILTPANVIVTLHKDSRQRLWLGSYQNGLISYDQGKITQYTRRNSALASNDIYGIQEDNRGNLWIATLDGCIQKMNVATREFETVFDMQGRINVRQLLYAGGEIMYAATSKGLLEINVANHECRFIDKNQKQNQALQKYHLYTLHKDSRNILWMGGTEGITFWNLTTDNVGYLERASGLPANIVTAISEDNNGQLWIGTCNGIARINLTQHHPAITHYQVGDGLTSNDVNNNSLYKLRNGNILVGTPTGYTTIIPQEVIRATYDAHIYLTGIESQYYTLFDMLNGKSPECATEVVLKQRVPFLQLQFSTLDFIESGNVRYAYRFKGKQADWTYTADNRIDFSILPSGKYELQVQASNAAGIWSPNVKTLTIRVLPPWYKTTWAYLAYLLIIAFFVWKGIAYIINRRKRLAKLAAIEQENLRQQKITDMKMQFFANVSHELRTPLSLIINPIEEFLTKYPQYRNTLLYTAQNNARYLHELINQLLDFRKLDASGETMNYMRADIVSLVKDQVQAFESIARKREIDYRVTSQQPDIHIDLDYDKVRKIVMNILSNAFKFTEDKGSIEAKINIVGSNVVLQFSDTGCGIDADQQKKIFQCFYQAENQKNTLGGSGIGLYLVAEYVKMHQGNIQVSTNIPRGSIFTVTLPMHAALTPRKIDSPAGETEEQPTTLPPADEHNYTILLVDDNFDFLDFLSACLSTSYNVLKATNGVEALEILKADNVDIVISDVMMPKMDGLELCTTIKSDISTSHIPVILLTAKASEEYQLEGLNMGADDYITKPFNMEVLKLRINKFIENSLKKHELFNEQIRVEPSRITITPLDRQFVEKAIRIVEDNINNAEFSVEELAVQLNISRGYLYKKMVKITGKTSLEFIRAIRMKRAQQWLAESQLQVAEIAYKLGYNSPKIFTKNFKEEFHISPSEFMRKHAGEFNNQSQSDN